MSFLEELQKQRAVLRQTSTIITTPSGEKFLENKEDCSKNFKLDIRCHGYIVDTKPDHVPSCVLQDFLYIGSQDAVCSENVAKYQLTHILSVGVQIPEIRSPDLKNMCIDCLDLPSTCLLSGIIEEAINFIETARKDGGRILVHCNAGVSRSAAVVIGYLMLQLGMRYEDAYQLLKSKRNVIHPNSGFSHQLRNLEKTNFKL